MQEHLTSPYIYIKKLFKKNSTGSQYNHDDIWDKSTNYKSRRVNKQGMNKKGEAKEAEKKERKDFYQQNLRMREFLFKYFRTVNQLVKEKHYSKVIYDEKKEEYDLETLFKLWASHKKVGIDAKSNPQQYSKGVLGHFLVSKEQFIDFIKVIGGQDKVQDSERFFEYCHEMVGSAQEGQSRNEKGVIVPKWWKMFEGDEAKQP